MATLIAVYNSEGCVGRCDAKCYTAHEPHCDCICAGANHGAGLDQAADTTRQLAQQWLTRAAAHGVGLRPRRTRRREAEEGTAWIFPW